jgi:predicted nucleic acid-binding protein
LIDSEILDRFVVHQLPSDAAAVFLRTAVQSRVAGGRIYDAHIAEIARLAGAKTVVTENRRHFTTLLSHGVRVLTSAECVAALGG